MLTAPFVILLQMKTFCTVYNFISNCTKIVDDIVVPAAEAPPAEWPYRLGPVSDPGWVMYQ